jgi:hypothetical protein
MQTLDKLEKLIVSTSAAKQATLLSQAHAHSAKSAAKNTVNTPRTVATATAVTAAKTNFITKQQQQQQQQQHVHNKGAHRQQQPHVANNKNTSSKIATAAVPRGVVAKGQAMNNKAAVVVKPSNAANVNGNANGNAAAVGTTGGNAAYREALKLKRITKTAREGIDR